MPKHLRRKNKHSYPNNLKKRSEQLAEDDAWLDTSEDEHGMRKTDLILQAIKSTGCEADYSNNELNLLGLQDGGFLRDNKIRRSCWLRLLQLNDGKDVSSCASQLEADLTDSVSRQIDLDVARSYGDILQGAADKRMKLKLVLRSFFKRNPDLHYYQGFHDVMMVVVDVFPQEADQIKVAEKLSRSFIFKDAHGPDFSLVESMLRAVQHLVNIADPVVGSIVEDTPFWGVSMLLTCFAHDVPLRHARLRLYDALIASYPSFQLYLVAALPLLPNVRRAILEAEDSSHAHEAIRGGACGIRSVRDADLLVRTARALTEKLSQANLLGFAETRCRLTRRSCLLNSFALDPAWSPPRPITPLPNPLDTWKNHLSDSKKMYGYIRKRYWMIAVFVVVLAASYSMRSRN